MVLQIVSRTITLAIYFLVIVGAPCWVVTVPALPPLTAPIGLPELFAE